MANSTDLADRELLRVRKLKQTMTTTPTKTSQMGRLNQARLKSSKKFVASSAKNKWQQREMAKFCVFGERRP